MATHLTPAHIVNARRKKGWTQRELAAAAKVSQSDISKIERGAIGPSKEKLVAVLASLGLDTEQATNYAPEHGVAYETKAFCPNPKCPKAQVRHTTTGIVIRPVFEYVSSIGPTWCRECGEVLERLCPKCGKPVSDGAFCAFCGTPYVSEQD